ADYRSEGGKIALATASLFDLLSEDFGDIRYAEGKGSPREKRVRQSSLWEEKDGTDGEFQGVSARDGTPTERQRPAALLCPNRSGAGSGRTAPRRTGVGLGSDDDPQRRP